MKERERVVNNHFYHMVHKKEEGTYHHIEKLTKEMPGSLSPGRDLPLLLNPEYSGINKEQRIPDRSKTAHRKPPVKCFLTHLYHFSRFHIYALIRFSLSELLHSVWQSLSPSTSLLHLLHSKWYSFIPKSILEISEISKRIHLQLQHCDWATQHFIMKNVNSQGNA